MKTSFKKVIAGLASGAIALTQFAGMAVAYTDVDLTSGVWYGAATQAMLDGGFLDASQTALRPGDNAKRAEFFTLVSRLQGGPIISAPAVSTFADVQSGDYFYLTLHDLAADGTLKGDNNCVETGATPCFAGPGRDISRAEAAATIVRAFNLASLGEADAFADVDASAWYAADLATAADHCVVQGKSNGLADPAAPMNRAEMITMLYRVDLNMTYAGGCDEPMMGKINNAVATSLSMVEVDFSMDVDATMGADASMYVVSDGTNDVAVSSASVNGSTVTLTLASNLTAGTTYTVSVTNMKDSEGGMFSDSEAFTFQSISQGDGDLEITLSNPNQVGDNVPQGAVAVNMVSYDLTASCSDSVSVSRMLMIHEGAGSRSDIDSVYVSIDGTRVSSTKSINSDEEANITISPALMIPACATVQVDIAADFNTGVTPGGEHRFALYSADDVRSNAKSVTMNGPLTGETFEVATVPAGIVQFKYNSVSPSTTDIGEEDVTVADFEVKASSDEDVTFMSITLEQDGTISSDDLTNLNLYRGSTKVAGPVEMMGDYVTFMVNEYIDSSDSEDYEVRADILDGAGDTIQFSLEETSDLKAVGAKYGNGTNGQVYGSPVDRTNHPAGSSQTVDVEAGEFTIELDGPISTTFSPDTDDANMANVTFEIGSEAVELNELWFFVSAVHGSGSGLTSNEIDDRLDNVELVSAYRTETLDFESFTTPAAGFAGYTLEDITFDRAVEEFTFNVDFTDNAVTGERYQVHVCTASQFATSAAGSDCAFTAFGIGFSPSTTEFHVDAEGAVSNEDIIDVDPGSVESGKIHDVEEASLEISVVSQRANDSAVDDANDINLFRFELSASETNSIFIDELKFKATSGSVGNGKNYALFIERDGVLTELEGGETPSNSDTEVIFDDFREEIAADEFVFFEVHADVDTSVASATLQLDFAGANPVANPTQFIDSEDNEGNDLDDADITVDTTNDGTLWTFVPAGTLETTVSTVTASKQLLAGNVDTTNILTIEFEAEFEDIRIEQLNFATTAPVDSVAYLELYVDGSTTPIIASNTSCAGVTNPGAGDIFCADNDIVVEDDTSVYVEVHPFLKAKENTTIGDTNIPGGAESGENVTVQLLSDLTMGPGNLAVEAYGVESDEQLTTTVVTTITSEPHTVVFAAVESIVNANSDGATSNSISVGNNPFGVFEWNTADNVNSSDVELDAIIFDVIANNVEFSAGSFVLYEEGKANNDVTCTESIVAPAPVTGSFEVTCTGLTASAVDTTLEANTSVAFVLEGVITDNASGPAGSTSTLQASITDFTDPALTSFGSANSHVQWNDSEATGAGSIFWIEFPTTFIKSTSYSQSN